MAAPNCPGVLAPETQTCSGRGTCVSENWCACPDGWTGQGDFAFGAPSCAVNIPAIQALWALVALVHVGTFAFALHFLRVKRAQGTKSQAPMYLGLLVVINNIGLIITGLTRAIDPLRTIGSDPTATVFFSIAAAAFWSATHVFIYAFLQLSIKQARMGREEDAQKYLKHLKISLPVSNIASLVASMLPLGMLGASNALQVQQLATSHYIILALELVVTGGILTPYFVKKVVHDIKQAISKNPDKSEKLVQVEAKLQRLQTELRNQMATNVLFAALMGFWPFLQVYGSSYFLPFAWTSAAITECLALYVNLPVTDKKTTVLTGTGSAEKSSTIRPYSATVTSPVANAVGTFTVMVDSHYEGTWTGGQTEDGDVDK